MVESKTKLENGDIEEKELVERKHIKAIFTPFKIYNFFFLIFKGIVIMVLQWNV